MDSKIISQESQFNTLEIKQKGFKVYEIETSKHPLHSYRRKDFYKVCILNGKVRFLYSDREIEVHGTSLFFGTPYIPYSTELISNKLTGFACLFTEEFLKSSDRSESLQDSPFFKIGGTPVLTLNKEQAVFIDSVFTKVLKEQCTNYTYKNELVRNYINLIIHEAIKMQPVMNASVYRNAAERITDLFIELLKQQFPVESKDHHWELRTVQDFANRLSIHVNHLNRYVKEITGKSTSVVIAERIVIEAKALLIHTNWSTSEIAYALGFEYPTYFNNYFKRLTGNTPKSFRAINARKG